VLECLDTITKERRPKLHSVHDFLGSGHSGEVTATSAIMESVEHFFNFSMSETMTKDNVDNLTINIITNEEVMRGFMSNMSLIIKSKVG